MSLFFEPIDLARQSDYLEFYKECPVKPSDYSFVNLWGWSEFYGLEWSFNSDFVWIRQTRPEVQYWAPVGNWDRDGLYGMIMNHLPAGDAMVRVPEILLKKLEAEKGSGIKVDELRGHWDYLYAAADLVALQGNRFHKKKNLLNQFKKNFAHQYLAFDEELVETALDMQENWCTWRDCEAEEALNAENRAITRVLNNWGAFENLMGGAILVNGEMAAYTIGERLSVDTLLIHFEKGSPGYKGIYQAINQMFVAQAQGTCQWVNREQDLDNEGLRKAKMSYNPVDFIKKHALYFT